MELTVTFEMNGAKERFTFENETWKELTDLIREATFLFIMAHEEDTQEKNAPERKS